MTTIQFLAEWALRSSILILSGALLLWALRVKDPSIRLAAWTVMLFASLGMPLFTAVAHSVRIPAIHATPQPVEAPVVSYAAAPEPVHQVPPQETHVSKPFDWPRAAVTIYVLVALALLLRLCFALAMSRRLLRSSRATGQASEGIETRESDRVASPVALGIVRPVIMLPTDWRQWDGAKLDAVLAHERSHIRRHDPAVQLLSAIHRTLLWHSPLSWFLHRRIVRVAEEASDDAAVMVTRDRASYAEVLLDFMQRGAPIASWLGVPMARYGRPDERIHRILDGTALSRGVTRWSVAAILAFGTPLAYVVAAVQVTTPQQGATWRSTEKPLTFDAASIKPAPPLAPVSSLSTPFPGAVPALRGNDQTGGPGTTDPGRIHYRNRSLKFFLMNAYDVKFDYQIQGPGWLDTERFEIEATMPPETTKEQFRLMLQNLLLERFKLATHREIKASPGYALAVAKNGPKLKESLELPALQRNGAPPPPESRSDTHDAYGFAQSPPVTQLAAGRAGSAGVFGPRGFREFFQQQTMHDLANFLQRNLGRPVTDATALTSNYDFAVTFWPEGWPASSQVEAPPDIFSALQSQLGLKLEPKKLPVDVLVVDHMEKTPREN